MCRLVAHQAVLLTDMMSACNGLPCQSQGCNLWLRTVTECTVGLGAGLVSLIYK